MEQFTEKLANADPFKTWWPFIIAISVGLAITIRNYSAGKKYLGKPNHRGRWFIVTGANGGIGREVCQELATRGANLILACRTMNKRTENLPQYFKKKFPNSEFELLHLDLSSFASIREFVQQVEKSHRVIDGLINQAGIMCNPFEITDDGYEMHLQVNYLGHFLLTALLLPLINKSTQGRVVNVSAHSYQSGKIAPDDPLNVDTIEINGEATYHARHAYSHSKLAVLLTTKYWAKRVGSSKSKVTVNCCTPGLVRGTGHFRRSPIMSAIFAKIITYPWMWLFMRSPNQGAQTIAYLALEPSVKVSGEYFNDCERKDVTQLLVDPAATEELTERLVKASLEAIQVTEIKL